MANAALVVLRAGAKSLHHNWTTSHRNWKLGISSFSTENTGDHPEADYFHYYKGGKWDGIYDFFKANPALIHAFDSFWFPDDDIDATPEDVEKIFLLAEQYELEVCQPALTKNSYFWHPIVLHNSNSKIRYTNFIEVMVPLISRDVLTQILPLFACTRSGFGLDYIWSRLTSDPLTKCAILDEVSVRHTRPGGSVLAQEIKKGGLSGREEMRKLSEHTGDNLDIIRPVTFRLVTRSGKIINGKRLCGLLQFIEQWPWLSKGRAAKTGIRMFCGSLYSHLIHKPSLAKIKLRENIDIRAENIGT